MLQSMTRSTTGWMIHDHLPRSGRSICGSLPDPLALWEDWDPPSPSSPRIPTPPPPPQSRPPKSSSRHPLFQWIIESSRRPPSVWTVPKSESTTTTTANKTTSSNFNGKSLSFLYINNDRFTYWKNDFFCSPANRVDYPIVLFIIF